MPFEQYYTVKEVCAFFRIGRTTLWEWMRKGLIEFDRDGCRPKFTMSYMEARQQVLSGKRLHFKNADVIQDEAGMSN